MLPSTSPTRAINPRVRLETPWTHDAIAYPGQRLPARARCGLVTPAAVSAPPSCANATRAAGGSDARPTRPRWSTRSRVVATEGCSSSPTAGTWRVRAKHADAGHAETLGPARTVVAKNWRKRYVGKRLGGFHNHKKMVAITIDDGPNRRTMEICSILERYGAKGTFFFTRARAQQRLSMAGAARVRPRSRDRQSHREPSHADWLVRDLVPAGVPTHGYDSRLDRVRSDLDTRDGRRYRPHRHAGSGRRPVSSTATGRSTPTTRTRGTRHRARCIASSSDGVDSGDVILIHQTHPETVKALPAICRELKRRGYKMVTLSELAANSKAR